MKMCNTTVVDRTKTTLFHYYGSKIQLIPTTHHLNPASNGRNMPSQGHSAPGSDLDIEANLILPISVPIPTRIGNVEIVHINCTMIVEIIFCLFA